MHCRNRNGISRYRLIFNITSNISPLFTQFQPLRLPVPHEPCATRLPGRRTAPAHWDGSSAKNKLIWFSSDWHACTTFEGFVQLSFVLFNDMEIFTSTPVWSLALLSKYCKPRAAAISDPALGLTTRRSPRSAWHNWLFIALGARSTVLNEKLQIILLKLPWPPGGRQGCLLSLISATFPPSLLQKAMYLPWEAFNSTFMMKEYQIKSGPLNFPLFSHPRTLFLSIKSFFRKWWCYRVQSNTASTRDAPDQAWAIWSA